MSLDDRRIPCAVEKDGEWVPRPVRSHNLYARWAVYEQQVQAVEQAAQARRDARANAVAELQAKVPTGVELFYTEVDEYGRENPTVNPDHLIVSLTVADMRRVLEES